ncbi:hypothetical protein Godav_019640 [Gossypium davidsonii]|uniref:C-type lectin receptor-like tyrosine-protein kinase n=1 Tax=Gossypium davidsonii TaxID=34287 RepID=A0A7J8R162_GOSDV|nr:hypothetical protein [Gossypium davidsonii]
MGVKVAPLQFIVLVASFAVPLVASDTASNGWTAPSNNSSKYKGNEAECPSGWVLAPNKTKCFGYNESLESWDESEIHCKRYHGHLAALTSFEELNFAQHLCGQSVNGCWVGGRVSNSTISSGWKWSDNTSVWNESVLRSSAQSICPKSSCFVNNSVDLCTLVKNGSEPLVSKRCNASHAFLCMVDIEDKCYYMHCHKEYLIILAVVSGLVLFTTFAVVVWLLAYKRSSTYSGLLPDGSKVAVKRLKRSSFQRKKEFYSEIGRVAKLHHPNLVAVKGCCYDHGDRYIVYEFITNGPLDRWLYHIPRGGRSLDWTMRIKIATTLAQGIAFLHDKVKPHVVHRDIRASNVLLDEEFGAHLMGVGLSKIVPWEVMHERTVMAGGTYGYLAPEFVYRNELTTKSDVYSFGVLLLEIVSGRRPAQQVDSVGWQSIFEWATPLVQAHHYPELLDPLISSSTSDIPEAGDIQKVVDLVYACTQNVPSMRPRMSHVVHQLQQLAQPALTKATIVLVKANSNRIHVFCGVENGVKECRAGRSKIRWLFDGPWSE